MAKYDLGYVKFLLHEGAWDFATESCRRHVQGFGITRADVVKVLMLLEPKHFRKQFGPCHTEFGTIDGDVYLLWCDVVTGELCQPNQGNHLYVKLAVDEDPDPEVGDACVLISFHESRP